MKKTNRARAALLLPALTMLALAQGAGCAAREELPEMAIELTSPAFADGDSIPERFTCGGADVSPPLAWSGVPEAAERLALICDDPDAPAGTWVHWVLYGLPAGRDSLPEGVPADAVVLDGARQGRNDFRRLGYGGPCPPPGKPHRYRFKLYALDAELVLEPGATMKELEKAMAGHVLAEGRLVGTYER
jgi:Raf kinase inhibitor-like YbhB/YbcL family protein